MTSAVPSIVPSIMPLGPQHDISEFHSSRPALDTWLRDRARRNQESADSRTFVITDDGRQVTGYYALTTSAAARVGLPGALRRNAPVPVSLLLLGQLAVDLNSQGQGLGRALLRDACLRTLSVLQHAGFRALAAHPLDETAETFYCRYGFSPIPDSQPRLLVLPVRRLQAAFAAAAQPAEIAQRS